MFRVLLIDDDHDRAVGVKALLEAVGHTVIAILSWEATTLHRLDSLRPDVIIADAGSPERDALEHIVLLSETLELPVVVLGAAGDEDSIRRAMRAGVAAYVAHGISIHDIAPILKVATLRYAEHRKLKRELQDAKSELSARKRIEKAKGILMQDLGLSEDDAHHRMRRLAMDRGKKLAEIAEAIILTKELGKH
ncbi:ANTAR domain-containing response regulator [Acidithiobacillus sulfuriphilus]|uniref:ANTAR domain-containing response regulator n=1 Tax=Acidithiobacillus sulfuriphilus TaxID=1867749 RepID=UPI003F5E8C2F